MISTLFLVILFSFEAFYLTSKQYKPVNPSAFTEKVRKSKKAFRIGASLILLVAIFAFITWYGMASGIFAAIVTLMAAASLIVILQPFAYLKLNGVALIYVVILLLEIFI